jgi:Tfp pilus assembly protein PilO
MLNSYTKLTYSSRNAVLVVALCMTAVAFYSHFVVPHRNCLRAAQTYQTLTDVLEKKNRSIADYVETKKQELQQLQNKSQLIDAELFDDVKAKQFFNGIQTAAEQTKCVINSLKFLRNGSDMSGSSQGPYVEASRATLSVTGSYKDIAALINKLQERPEQVWIDSLGIKLISGRLLSCDMTITIYVKHSKDGPLDE